MSEQKYWSDEDVITYLKKLRVAIDQGLQNLGVELDDDEVEGYTFGPIISAPSVSPSMLQRLGPSFSPNPAGGMGADNGHCGIICGADPTLGGGGIFE